MNEWNEPNVVSNVSIHFKLKQKNCLELRCSMFDRKLNKVSDKRLLHNVKYFIYISKSHLSQLTCFMKEMCIHYTCAFSTNRFLNSAALAYVCLADSVDECHNRAKKQNRKSTSINNKIGRLRFSLLLYFQCSLTFFLCLHHLLSLTYISIIIVHSAWHLSRRRPS